MNLAHCHTLPPQSHASISPVWTFFRPWSLSTQLPPRPLRLLSARRIICAATTIPTKMELDAESRMTDPAHNGVLEAIKGDDLIEVGLISSTHGVNGEVKVLSRTDFPEQRFEQPGIRWIGYYRMGKLVDIRQVKLLSGREIIVGKGPSWLLTFQGFETKEKANELVGGTVFVRTEDRPALEQGQIYLPDLVGMSVSLKSSGEVIGSIVDIFNSGASDLLRVKLSSTDKNYAHEKKEAEKERFVWIPFVEEIVPVIDNIKREIEIVPPQGLLELNAPSEGSSKRELRNQALKTRRKMKEKIGGIKKRVLALKQDHILAGLASGDEMQREALRAQLMGIDFKLFERALESCFKDPQVTPNDERWLSPPVSVPVFDWSGLKEWVTTASRPLSWNKRVEKETWSWWRQGLELVAEGRVAVVSLPTGDDQSGSNMTPLYLKPKLQYQARKLLALQELAGLLHGEKLQIPWVVVTFEALQEITENLLREGEYFGLSEGQVFILKLSCLPCISCEVKDGRHRILMDSDWKIITGPGGEGQLLLDLKDSGILDDLSEIGVDYIHVCSTQTSVFDNTDPVLFGYLEKLEASVGTIVTTDPLEGDYRVLSQQDVSSTNGRPVKDKKTIFLSEVQEDGAHSENITKRYSVMKPADLENVLMQTGQKVYRVPPFNKYTFSVEYLRHLSDQRYAFSYESVLKKVPHKHEKEENQMESPLDALQLKCSMYNALMFCTPSKVALLDSGAEGLLEEEQS